MSRYVVVRSLNDFNIRAVKLTVALSPAASDRALALLAADLDLPALLYPRDRQVGDSAWLARTARVAPTPPTPNDFFPRIPRFRFRAVAKEIEQWVREENALIQVRTEKDPETGIEVETRWWEGQKLKEGEGIRYKKMTFVEGNRSVLGVLRDVAQQVELLAKVAEKDAKGELHH